MDFKDNTIASFNTALASSAPTPGGGAAAALQGAVGISMTGMVLSLTVGKKKYADYQDFVQEQLKKTQKMTEVFYRLMQADADAFGTVGKAYAMPKTTEEEKAARNEAVQAALKVAVVPPCQILSAAEECLRISESVIGKTNTGVISDLAVAAISLRGAAQSAWFNILVNVELMNDKEFASACKAEGQRILDECERIAELITQAAEKQICK